MHRYKQFAIEVRTTALAGSFIPMVEISCSDESGERRFSFPALCAHDTEEMAHHHGIRWARQFIDQQGC